jgi:hypothetical protein
MDLGLYTTIHPGTRPFLQEWYASVRAQTDPDFELWVGLDGLSIEEACSAIGHHPSDTVWVESEAGDTPAQVRERAWRDLCAELDAVVLVDADDLLLPERIERARKSVQEYEGAGCALRLVDEARTDLGLILPPETYASVEAALPSFNIFGLGNSAYRTDLLAQSLPIPVDVTLIDWYLSTHAWLQGASLTFDKTVQMEYRQHEHNMLPLLPPFSTEGVKRATVIVRDHFQTMCTHRPKGTLHDRWSSLKQRTNQVECFAQQVLTDAEFLKQYTARLNRLEPLPLWWSCVAHPDLENFWMDTTDLK